MLIKYVKRVSRLLLNRLGYNIVRAESREISDAPSKFGEFSDSRGNTFDLIKGIRDNLKPGWQDMLQKPVSTFVPPDNKTISKNITGCREYLSEIESFLSLFSYSFSFGEKDILEIGCYDGKEAYSLAEKGAKSVTGSDIAAYYIYQTPVGEVLKETVDTQNNRLNSLRNIYRKQFEAGRTLPVDFIEDDICKSSLKSESFDLIFSREVLEHLQSPQIAFQQMYRILKPFGLSFHEYNPFFSINGGHSLCTLDFLWGHARIDESDFVKYLRDIRPPEFELARHFYTYNLNRMTLSDLTKYASQSGFEILALIPWVSRHDLRRVNKVILKQCKDIYPNISPSDLISPTVWVLLRKNDILPARPVAEDSK